MAGAPDFKSKLPTHTHIREFGIKSSGAQVTEKLFPGFQVYLQVPD